MEVNDNEPVPDDLTCNRSDGPDSKSFCGSHLYPPPNPPISNPNPKSPLRIRLLVKPRPKLEPEPEPTQPKPEPEPDPVPIKPTTQPDQVVPDHLRCTRNDGRSWRCKKRAVEGQCLCGPHLIKLQSQYQKQKDRKRKKLNVKLPKRTSASSDCSPPLALPIPPPPSLSDCNGVTLVGSHVEKAEVEGGSGVLALTVVGPENADLTERQKDGSSSRRELDRVPDSLRCERTNGGEWRCKRKVKEGESVCEFHLNNKKDKKKKKKNEIPKRDENVDSDRKMEGGGGDEESGTRCKRTDGRGWRCKRSVLEGKTLCEVHFEQGRLRQRKVTVPESLKIKNGCGDGDNKVEKKIKKKRALEDLENDSEKGMKRMKAELIRVFLKREIIESSNKSEKPSDRNDGGEVTKDLPYGLMAIPPAPTSQFRDDAGSLGIKVDGGRLKQTVNRRFRSKNVEPPPISTLKVVPYVGKNLGKVKSNGRKKCHWCRLGEGRMLTKCKTCKKKFFCSDCIKERSFDDQQVEQKCPVCSGSCNCMACLRMRAKNVGPKEEVVEKLRKGSKYELLQYLINYLLPVLEQINQEQSIELETEAKLKGQDLSEVEIGLADVGCSDRCCCNNCKSPILDFHRSCPNCSYNLCLSCCREYSQSGTLRNVGVSTFQIHNRTQTHFSLKCCSDKSSDSGDLAAANSLRDSAACLLSCPPMELGGCDVSLLDLRCIFPLNWTKELEISAKEMVPEHESPQVSDKSAQCVLCHSVSVEVGKNKEIQEASRRKESEDNLLYCPSSSDDRDHLFVHFQKHWQKGQPVKVRNVLHGVSNISWNPIDMFTSYLEKSSGNCETEKDAATEVVNYSDWYNVEIGTKDSFIGCTGDKYTHRQHKTLKLTAKLSSALSRRLFEDHYREIICSLPLEEYTNPDSGLLNLAGKLPEEFPDYKLGPHVCISCGSKEEISRGELVTQLCYNSYDVVNILVHVGDASCSTEQINKIRKLIKQNNAKDKEGCVENEETRMQSGISVEAGVAAAACNSAAINGVSGVNGNDDKSPVKVQCSDTDSDVSMICSGTSDSPKKAVDQISCQDLAGSSSLSGNRLLPEPCGAQWDVFRRQDIPKVLEYIADHVDELNYGYGPLKIVHPIFDGSFYLDATHKMRLKEEFDIEPWTFHQYLGEAVFIPAGCAYQIRNIKSSVNIALGFVSPENASECINLGDEIRVLPINHRAKQDKLEVEKMAICSLDEAIKEMYRLKSTQRHLNAREV